MAQFLSQQRSPCSALAMFPRIAVAVATVIAVATLLPSAAIAQAPSGVITGRVFDAVTEQPIVAATIQVIGQTAATASAEDGTFTLRGVVPGIVQLDVRRVGYAPVRKTDVAVSAGKPIVVAIALTKLQLQLAAVTIRPSAFAALPTATPVSETVLSAEELRRTPGALEDVVAALSSTPGIGITTGGRNDLFVRGGAAYENLFVVDNIEVPNINHFGTQGSTGGPLSLMNVRFIENAALSAGGFGVRYGDRVSSVTNLTLREGNRERMSGEVNISASQFGAILEGPVGRKDASFVFNVRRSYLDLLFKALGVAFVPTYTDATLKATWRPTRRDVVSFLAVGAIDAVAFNNDSSEDRVNNSQVLGTSQDQYFSGLTWKRLFANGVATTTLGRTWSRYRTAQNDSLLPPQPVFRAYSTEGENSLRTAVTWQATPTLELDAGASLRYASRLQYDVLLPGFLRRDQNGAPRALTLDTSFTAVRGGMYAQAAVQATSALRVTAGLRADRYDAAGAAISVAPRASAVLQLDEPTTLSLSAGRYYQPSPFIWLVGDPTNRDNLGPLRADQVVAGLQRIVNDEWRWQVEGFVKRYANYPARVFRPQAVLQPSGFDDVTSDIPFGLEPLSSEGTGQIVGVEALLQKKLGALPFYGLVALSYNRTSFSGLDGIGRRGAFDTPIIANVVGGWRPSARWEFSGRMRAATGLPYTPIQTSGQGAGTPDFARVNALRLPTFVSVDARVDRRWVIGGTQLVTFIDVGNINGRANVTSYRWNPRTRIVEANESLAILPTIGINWEF